RPQHQIGSIAATSAAKTRAAQLVAEAQQNKPKPTALPQNDHFGQWLQEDQNADRQFRQPLPSGPDDQPVATTPQHERQHMGAAQWGASAHESTNEEREEAQVADDDITSISDVAELDG